MMVLYLLLLLLFFPVTRYDLQFSVSDRAWQQQGVAANVTVTVQTLPSEALTHAVPLTLSPITPEDITRGWSPSVMLTLHLTVTGKP